MREQALQRWLPDDIKQIRDGETHHAGHGVEREPRRPRQSLLQAESGPGG